MGIFDFFRRKNGDQSESEESAATMHCFVLCKSSDPGDLSRADDVVQRVFGSGYSAGIDDEMVSVLHGEETIGLLTHIPMPIPGEEAEDNADQNFLWPDGRNEVGQHQSQVIVVNSAGGDQTPVQSAIAVAKLALVALDVFDGLGVYWGNASVCNSREVFENFCEDVSEEHIPVPVLLRFQLVRDSPDSVGLYTLGMEQFGLMEIEVDSCKLELDELFDFVSNIAHYLIQNGPVIADGNTVGGSEDERILVRHQPSMIDDDRTVYKIMFNA